MELIVGLIFIACTIVVLYVVLRIGAAITRTAVRLTNGVLGGRDLVEDDFRYRGAAYDTIPRPKSLAGVRIPVPGVGYSILVNIACAVVGHLFLFGVSVLAVMVFGMAAPALSDPNDPAAALAALTAALGVLLLSLGGYLFGILLVLKMALPTTFVRAAVVVFWQFVISAVIGVVMVGVLFAFSAAGGGGAAGPTRPAQGGWVK